MNSQILCKVIRSHEFLKEKDIVNLMEKEKKSLMKIHFQRPSQW